MVRYLEFRSIPPSTIRLESYVMTRKNRSFLSIVKNLLLNINLILHNGHHFFLKISLSEEEFIGE